MAAPLDPRTGLPVVGMVGGGQLARMTHQAAIALGQSLRVLAADPPPSRRRWSPPTSGSATTATWPRCSGFAEGATCVTFDHEHVPTEHLRALEPAGRRVAPGPAALVHAQDKLVMRRALADGRRAAAGLGRGRRPCTTVTAFADERRLAGGAQDPARRLRRQGRVRRRRPRRGRRPARARTAALLAEERVAIRRELAALVARSPFGQVAAWPVVETVQRDGICVEVLAPAPGLADELAAEAAGARRPDRRPARRGRACWPSSCSRPPTACWSTSWRCGRTTAGTGPSRAHGRRSSSSTCGRCSTSRSGEPR